ncbi:MAG: ATP-binding protein, partial [Verrucomicrobiota bacterium]
TDESLGQGMGEILVIAAVNLVCLPFMLVFLWRLSRHMLHPLQKISETATRIRHGKLKERIEVEQQEDELGVLARTINEAFDRYQDANEKLQRFGADASHQLRTPLTSIRAAGEICLSRERSSQEYRETIESMLEDATRLTGIVERLLMLARLESHALRKHFTNVDLAGVAEKAAEQYRPLCEEKSISLDIDSDAACVIRGDASLIEQAAANLLDNAIRHAPRGGAVSIRTGLSQHGETAYIQVEDNGPGVPDGLRAHVFDRFRRGPQPAESGTGLGLAVVREIVNAHGGSAHLERTDNERTRFRMAFPRP